jgi:hypothetical protein
MQRFPAIRWDLYSWAREGVCAPIKGVLLGGRTEARRLSRYGLPGTVTALEGGHM